MNNIIYLIQYSILGLIQLPLYYLLFRILDLRGYKLKNLSIFLIVILGTFTVFITNKLYSPFSTVLEINTNSNTVGGVLMVIETIIFFLIIFINLKTKKILIQSWSKITTSLIMFTILSSLIFYIAHLILFFLTLTLFFFVAGG